MKKITLFAVLAFLCIFSCPAQTHKSVELYEKGIEAYWKKDYKTAEKYFRLTWQEDSLTMSPTLVRQNNSLDWLTHSLYKLGRKKEAFHLDATPEIIPLDRRLTVETDSLHNVAMDYYRSGTASGLILAELKFSELLREMEQRFGSDSYHLGFTNLIVSSIYMQAGKADEALHYARIGTDILDRYTTEKTPYKMYVPLSEAAWETVCGNLDKAVTLAENAFEESKGYLRYIPFQYSQVVELLSGGYYWQGRIDSVKRLIGEVEKEYLALPPDIRANCSDIVLTLVDLKWNYQELEGLGELIEDGLSACDRLRGTGNHLNVVKARLLSTKSYLEERELKYEEALALIEESLALIESVEEVNPADRTSFLVTKMRHLYNLGEASVMVEEGERIRKSGMVKTMTPDLQAIYYQFMALGANATSREDLFVSSLRNVKDIYEKNGLDLVDGTYFDICLNLADIAVANGDKSEPATTFARLSAVLEKNRDSSDPGRLALAESFLKCKQAIDLWSKGKKDEAYTLTTGTVDKLEKNGMVVPKNVYEILLNTLPDSIHLTKSVEIAEKMLLSAQREGVKSLEYADALVYMGIACGAIGDFEGSKKYFGEAEEIMKQLTEIQQTPRYNNIMSRLVIGLCGAWMADEAMDLIDFMENNRTRKGWKWMCETCWNLMKLECLVQLQRKEEALKLLDMLSSNFDRHSDLDTASSWCRLGSAAMRLGRLTDATEYYERGIAAMPPVEEWNADQMMFLTPYFMLLSQIGETERANELARNLWTTIGNDRILDPTFEVLTLTSTVFSILEKEGEEAARTFIRENVRKIESDTGSLSTQTAMAYNLAVEFEKGVGKAYLIYNDFKDYYNTLKSNREHVGNMHSGFLLSYAEGSMLTGEYEKALEALDFARDTYSSRLSDSDLIRLYSSYGRLYIEADDKEKGYENYRKSFDISKEFVLDNFLTMTSEERSKFWLNYCNFYKHELPTAAERGGYTPEFSALVYDAALFSSGLLLASDISVAEAVAESGDRKVRKLYEKFNNQKALYEKATGDNGLQGMQDIQHIERLKENLKNSEKQLLGSLSKSVGNYNRRLSVGWEDVRNALKEGEVAVEFLEMPVDRYMIYLAVVLRADGEYPVLRRLFVHDMQDNGTDNDAFRDCYTTESLTECVWNPIADLLEGCSTIWFSPQGKLTVTAIESMPGIEKIAGPADTRFRRLTSTRELVRMDTGTKGTGADIYGDIDFSLSAEGMIKAAGKREYDNREAGGGIGALPGTKEEAEYIDNLLKDIKGFDQRNTRCHTGAAATETSFKLLSGKSPRLLHVGTHGFFAKDDIGFSLIFMNTLTGALSSEDRAMMRSGLLFAGAEGTLYEDRTLPDYVDNGVLTAREISSMKLQGNELTVLSACETALGAIGADGVFGLQRGFKKAGAGALLMSLWKVSDESTTELMKSFYRHWLKDGLDKYAALEEAKKDVRKTPGWEHPMYWAPFILLDAVD